MLNLTKEDKVLLLRMAREALRNKIEGGASISINSLHPSDNLFYKTGLFVTLTIKAKLRGCIGHVDSNEYIYTSVKHIAESAAFRDPRFPPLKSKELKDTIIEISVLTPKIKIENIEEIDIHKHGIYIKNGHQTGTFLPQVALETGWNIEELLGRCARDKVGIGWFDWKDSELFIYEVIKFDEEQLGLT